MFTLFAPPTNNSRILRSTSTLLPEDQKISSKKALFISFNYFNSKGSSSQDSKNLLDYMKLAFHVTNTQYLTDSGHPSPTKETVLEALGWLCKGVNSGDVLFLWYSGICEGKKVIICPNGEHISAEELEQNLFSNLPAGVTLLYGSDSNEVPEDLSCRHKIVCVEQKYEGSMFENGWRYPKSFTEIKEDIKMTESVEKEETHFMLLILTAAGAPRGALSFAALKSFQYCYSHSLTCSQFLSNIAAVLKCNSIASVPRLECGQWMHKELTLGRIFALPI